eukprot:8473862-Pyramimonas_sp.AAC.1
MQEFTEVGRLVVGSRPGARGRSGQVQNDVATSSVGYRLSNRTIRTAYYSRGGQHALTSS